MGLLDGGAFTGAKSSSAASGGARAPRVTAPRRLGAGQMSGMGGGGLAALNEAVGGVAPSQWTPATGTTYAQAAMTPGGSGMSPTTPPPITGSKMAIPPTYHVTPDQPIGWLGPISSPAIRAANQQRDNQQSINAGYQNNLAGQLANAQYSPQLAALTGSDTSLLARQGLIDANYGQQSGALSRESQLAQQLLGTQTAMNGIDRASIARQRNYYNTLGNLNEQGIGVQRADARATAATDTRGTKSDYTARGAWQTPGLGRDLTDISGTLDRRLRGFDIDSSTNTTNTREQVARLSDRSQQLDVEANRLGIQSAQLGAQLDSALARLGLQQVMSVGDLMDALSGNNLQRQQIAQQIMQYATNIAPSLPGAPPAYRTGPSNAGGGTGGNYRS